MLKEINPAEISINPFSSIGSQWMLVTAGDSSKANTMTASWGGMGVLWNKNVVTCYIRPQRYTREFVDKYECFSLNFLPEKYRKELAYCGRVSGRDEDKIQKTGFTLCNDLEAPYFGESETVLICKKLYLDKIRPEGMLVDDVDGTFYPSKDYSLIYIAEVIRALTIQK